MECQLLASVLIGDDSLSGRPWRSVFGQACLLHTPLPARVGGSAEPGVAVMDGQVLCVCVRACVCIKFA